MFCSKCGKELPDDAVKCDACGSVLKPAAIVELVSAKSSLLNQWIDCGLNYLRKLPFEKMVNALENLISRIGVFSFYLLGLVGLVGGLITALHYESLQGLWIGLGWLLLCILFAYFGTKLLQSIKALVLSTNSLFSSQSLLDCITVLLLLSGLAALAAGIYLSFDTSDGTHFWYGLIGFFMAEFGAVCSLAPQLVSTEAGIACSPGEELIGLGTFFIKIMLRMLPFIWCIGALLTMIYVIIHLGSDNVGEHIMTGFSTTIVLGLLPLAYYLGFLLYYFVIDLARAVLSLPGKLDRLNK